MGNITQNQTMSIYIIAITLSTLLILSVVTASFELANADRVGDMKHKIKEKISTVKDKINSKLGNQGGHGGGHNSHG